MNTNMLNTAYVPMQCLTNIYKPQQALCKGTIFPELVSPFEIKPRGFKAND